MSSRGQKPALRDFLLLQAETRTKLCSDDAVFDPCEELSKLSSFEKATLMTWSSDSSVDKGLNLYILLHYLSAINSNSYYYHYVNNGSSDGTNLFGHIIGTSGSGKSSALAPHMDAVGRVLSQMDINEEYIQRPNKKNDLSFDQQFIVSNATALNIYRSLIYGNRLLCSTECDTLLTNLGVYGNQYNDSRFTENVNMLIQMFDGTKHQNRATLSTSYVIPEGRRASIIGASVGDAYARVSQQHYEGNGISGAHNRFTHYPCPVKKAVKINSATTGVVSNMVPSLQHVYTVSFILGKVEYIPRQNIYDKSKKKGSSILNAEMEEKWNRLRPKANRQYNQSLSNTEIELEEPEFDSNFEQSKSAFFYMFNRVYTQWYEATMIDKQEHDAIINFKNSTKIPRFICNFARFRTIMDILWNDSVYPLIEVSEVVQHPYRVSDVFIQAVKVVVEKYFPENLRKSDGTKVLIIEKDTAIMGDLFFGYIDNVSRQLFDLSFIQGQFNSSPIMHRVSNNSVVNPKDTLMIDDAFFIIQSKLIFFSASTFSCTRRFHNKKQRLTAAIEFLFINKLIHQSTGQGRFIRGAHITYALATPSQAKFSVLSVAALDKLNISTETYDSLWQKCLLPAAEIAQKFEKSAIEFIRMNISDYISIINRLGNADDRIAKEILLPGLLLGTIGIDLNAQRFSLAPQHISLFESEDDVKKQLKRICFRAVYQESIVTCSQSSMFNEFIPTSITDPITSDLLQADVNNSIPIHDINDEHEDISVLSLSTSKTSDEAVTLVPITDFEIMDGCISALDQLKTILDHDESCSNRDCIGLNTIEQENYQNQRNSKQCCDRNIEKLKLVDEATGSMDSTQPIDALYPSVINDVSNKSLNVEFSLDSELSLLPSETSNEIHDNDSGSNKHISTSHELTSLDCSQLSQVIEGSPNHSQNSPIQRFSIITLSKRLMLKPFLIFTNTDVTRLYNRAETKNTIIEYLKQNKLICQIEDLFLSTSSMKKVMKPEIGYLKLFPASQSAFDTSSFETKLREKVGINFDDYRSKIFRETNSVKTNPIINNVFSTAHNNWLLNRIWYEKLNDGFYSSYYENQIVCPDGNISSTLITAVSVSNDNVHDSFDRPRTLLTGPQRVENEMKRLGIQRQRESEYEPPQKRQRKPKRFVDDG